MNWPRTIIDGTVMALLINAVVGLGFLLYPQAYSTMFPREIREAAAPFVDKKDVRKMKLILYPLYLRCLSTGRSAHNLREFFDLPETSIRSCVLKCSF